MKVLESEEDFNEAHQLIMKSSYVLHPMWNRMPPDRQEDSALQRYMLRQSFKHRMAFGYYAQAKLVGLTVNLPVRDYLNVDPPKCPKSKLFAIMTPHQKILDEKLKRHTTNKGEMDTAALVYWGLVDPDVSNKKIARAMLYETMMLLWKEGWRSCYTVTNHENSLKVFLKDSPDILAAEQFQEEPFKGHKIHLVRVGMESVVRTYHTEGVPVRPKL